MQERMKKHQLTTEQIEQLLERATVGRIATNGEDGYPYIVPVHFVVIEGNIYIHGLIKGSKISNLIKDSKVCFEVDEMDEIILPSNEDPCDTNTAYESVIIFGTAEMVEDRELKVRVLDDVVAKYASEVATLSFPEKMMKATGVIEITPVTTTGKFYR